MRAKRTTGRIALISLAAALGLIAAFTLGTALGRGGDKPGDAVSQRAANAFTNQAVSDGQETSVSVAKSSAEGTASAASSAAKRKNPAAYGRLLRRDGSVELAIAKGALKAKVAEATRIATALGGQVTASNIGVAASHWEQERYSEIAGAKSEAREQEEAGYAQLILRVPEARFNEAIDQLSKLGEAHIVTNSEDVTSEYVDLEARLRQARRVEARLLRFLERAATMQEVLLVQDRIDATQLQIEQLSGELKQLKRTTSFSTVSVTLNERTQEVGTGVGGSIWVTLKHSCALLGAGVKALGLFLTAALPFLLVFGAIGGAGWWAWRSYRRRRAARASTQEASPQETSPQKASQPDASPEGQSQKEATQPSSEPKEQ